MLAVSLALGASGTWLGLTGASRNGGGLACQNGSVPMRRLELVLGMSRRGQVDISEPEWSTFLAREVTPRFPDGLTVLEGNGQWKGSSGAIVREPARLLLVWVKPTPDLEARIDGVRAAWKAAHSQESVLRADGLSCVSF